MPQIAENRYATPLLFDRSGAGIIRGKALFLARAFIFLSLLGIAPLLNLPGTAWASPAPEKIRVVASILPLADFCRQLGGDRVEVQVIVPPGASPHVFEPPPSVVAQVSRAQVFVYIGAGLEPWVARLLQARGASAPSLAVVEAAHGAPLLEADGHDHDRKPASGKDEPLSMRKGEPAPHSGHAHDAGNPHIWLDPVLAQDICRKIAAALVKADPGHRAQYEANLQRYVGALQELHQEIEREVRTFQIRDFISFHAAFSYFARRYGLHEAGVIEAAPGREPGPRHIQKIVATIRRCGMRVVFAEPQLNPRIAEVIAREAGVKVLMLDPEGGRPPYGTDYLKMMRHNLAVLAEAMK